MTDKIDTLFSDINTILNDYSGNAEKYIAELNTGIQQLDSSIQAKNTQIDESLTKFKPIETIPVAGGNNKKNFLHPTAFRDTYHRIKMNGGSKDDIRNMIYTIEKMQRSGINRDFFPKLLTALKARR